VYQFAAGFAIPGRALNLYGMPRMIDYLWGWEAAACRVNSQGLICFGLIIICCSLVILGRTLGLFAAEAGCTLATVVFLVVLCWACSFVSFLLQRLLKLLYQLRKRSIVS